MEKRRCPNCNNDGLDCELCGATTISESTETAGYATSEEITEAGLQWLKENPNRGVPYSMTVGYWNCVLANMNAWGFRIVKK